MQKRFLFVFLPFVACAKNVPEFTYAYRSPLFNECIDDSGFCDEDLDDLPERNESDSGILTEEE